MRISKTIITFILSSILFTATFSKASALALLNVAVKRIEDRIKVIIVLDILIDYPSHYLFILAKKCQSTYAIYSSISI